jgi:hypothetical protein
MTPFVVLAAVVIPLSGENRCRCDHQKQREQPTKNRERCGAIPRSHLLGNFTGFPVRLLPPRRSSSLEKEGITFLTLNGLRHLAASLHTPTHQLCFLLSSAYFKATKRFFAPEDFRPREMTGCVQSTAESPERDVQ